MGFLRSSRRMAGPILATSFLLILVKTLPNLCGSNVSRLTQTVRSTLSFKLRGQRLIDYMGANLRVNYVKESELVRLRLTNSGDKDIPPNEHWAIYFNHVRGLSDDEFLKEQGLRQFHIDGWLYGLETAFDRPNTTFLGLKAGESLTLSCGANLTSKTSAFPRWYVAGRMSSDLEPRILLNTDSETLDFVDKVGENWDPVERYTANTLTAVQTSPSTLRVNIIPTPLSVTPSSTSTSEDLTVRLGSDWTINHIDDLSEQATYLSEKLSIPNIPSSETSGKHEKQILLRLGNLTTDFTQFPFIRSLDEAYVMKVDQQTILIEGQTKIGVFYGIQSLLSLHEASSDQLSVPLINIIDAPRIPYRGLLLDVARNFIGKKDIFKILQVMAMYKMNKLHLHLTDDQGWRLQIPGLPELTQIGSRRSHDIRQRSTLLPYFGSGPFSKTLSGYEYYSIKDYRDILWRASTLNIDVIPEIDMPGHAHAAIQSMRMRAEAAGGVNDFLLSDPEDTSSYTAVNKHKDTVVNPCLESTFRFIEHVLKALKTVHQDINPQRAGVVHLGGDEVPRGALTKSPACAQFLAKRPKWKDRLNMYFMLRAEKIASRLGLQLQAWEDGLMTSHNEIIPRSQWNGTDVYVNAWNNSPRQKRHDTSFKFAKNGYKVILSHATRLYLDHPYEPDDDELGFHWAVRSISTRNIFNYMIPLDETFFKVSPDVRKKLCKALEASECARLTSADNIIGLQASLWTEFVRTTDQVEYMLYPRLLAVAERAWHIADWESTPQTSDEFHRLQQLDWRHFATLVGQSELRRLERLGVRYRLPPPGVRYSKQMLKINTEFPGLPVEYSTDKGVTWNEVPSTMSLDSTTLSGNSTTKLLFKTRSRGSNHSSRVTTFG